MIRKAPSSGANSAFCQPAEKDLQINFARRTTKVNPVNATLKNLNNQGSPEIQNVMTIKVGNKNRNYNASASLAGTIPAMHGLINANYTGISCVSKTNDSKGSFQSSYTTGLVVDKQKSSPNDTSATVAKLLTAQTSSSTVRTS